MEIQVICGTERAVVHSEGGIEFSVHTGNSVLRYVTDLDPSKTIQRLALAVRREAYPQLPPLTLEDLE